MRGRLGPKCGPEFGADNGKKAIIMQAMYGHKSAGAAFRNHLAECMRTLGIQVMPGRSRCLVQGVYKARGQVPLLLVCVVVC